MEFSVHSLGAPTIRAITRWPEAVVTSGALCFVGSVPATWRAMRFWAVRSMSFPLMRLRWRDTLLCYILNTRSPLWQRRLAKPIDWEIFLAAQEWRTLASGTESGHRPGGPL